VPPGCREADARPDGVADPTEPPRAAEAAAIRSELDRAEAIASAGRYADALAVVDALVPRAEALAHPPVSAELAWQRGLALLDHGDLDEGFTSLEAAYADGLRLGHDEVAIGAAVSLAVGAANHRDDPTETLRWAKHARPLAERQGEDSPAVFRVRLAQAAALRLDGQLVAAKRQLRAVQADLTEALPPADPLHESAWIHLGHLYVAMGRFDDALAAYEEAKTRAIQIYGEGHPDVAKRIGDIGGVYSQLERFDQSVDTLREGLEQLQRALGPDHPDVAAMQLNLAAGLGTVDEIDEAEALLQASLATKTRVYGPDSVELYRPLVNLGTLRKQQRDPAGALVMLERALALQERAHHRTHPALVATLLNLASTHLWTGDHAAAAAAYDRMLAIAEANFEHPHRDFAQAYLGLANLRLGQERHAEALGYYEQATTEYEALGPSASGPLTMILTGRALTLEELGRKDEAGAIYLRAAQRGFEGSHMLAWERAMTRLRAGQWLRRHAPAGADDRTRAIALVEQGLVDAIEAGDHGTEFADEARRWLKRHRR
jgi:tetratricopeptide (TPR) repeat protein